MDLSTWNLRKLIAHSSAWDKRQDAQARAKEAQEKVQEALVGEQAARSTLVRKPQAHAENDQCSVAFENESEALHLWNPILSSHGMATVTLGPSPPVGICLARQAHQPGPSSPKLLTFFVMHNCRPSGM